MKLKTAKRGVNMENSPQEFGFEIDFLPVGDKTRSGDAVHGEGGPCVVGID